MKTLGEVFYKLWLIFFCEILTFISTGLLWIINITKNMVLYLKAPIIVWSHVLAMILGGERGADNAQMWATYDCLLYFPFHNTFLSDYTVVEHKTA
jgi:hypothetical protein